MAETTKLQYKLDAFEGPLDMLLALIAKNKLNIYDIQISQLLEQYMEQIKEFQERDLDIASEFLEMASRLVYIKSALLLPKYEEEGDDLKKELTGQLLEYQLCKEVAKILSENATYDIFCTSQSHIEFDQTYTRLHKTEDIANAFVWACGRGKKKKMPTQDDFSGIVARKIVSVSSRVVFVMRKLHGGNNVKYRDLFIDGSEKSELVATFLAILELVKTKRIYIEGNTEFASVKMLDRKNGEKEQTNG